MIGRVYIAGYKYDVAYTRACVASVRNWYPNINITLIKDRFYGDYSTVDIEKNWDVDVLDVGERVYSWGFSKFEPLFLGDSEKFLVLDSDTLMIGDVLDTLSGYSEEFVVSSVETDSGFQSRQYYDPQKLNEFDSEYIHPGRGFNTGQWVGTSGIFKRSDFDNFVCAGNPPVLKQEELFKYGEQGLLNYFLYKKQQTGVISLAEYRFMESGDNPFVDVINTEDLSEACSHRLIIHWAGLRKEKLVDCVNARLLLFFETKFYERIPLGRIRKLMRYRVHSIFSLIRSFVKKILV